VICTALFGDRLSAAEAANWGDRKEGLSRAAARRGVRALLEGLHRAGFRQVIGSSAPRASLELILRLTGIERFFRAVIGMEETQRGKPGPQVFQVAAERLGVPPARCVVLEDAVAGVQAAHAAGKRRSTCVPWRRPTGRTTNASGRAAPSPGC
jgi:beta-phosphoglucomutase